IFFKKSISFKKLVYSMNSITCFGISFIKSIFTFYFFFFADRRVIFKLAYFCTKVGKNEKVLLHVASPGKLFSSFFGQINCIIFFIDDEIQFIINYVHVFSFFAKELKLCILH